MMTRLEECAYGVGQGSQQRLAWIDTLKSLGILFVIYGHAPGLTPWVDTYVFSFHMPLFFFISGLFFTPGEDKSLSCYAAGRAVRRLVPYLFFGLLTALFWFLVTRHFGRNLTLQVKPWVPFVGLFYGTNWGDLLFADPPLWFLPCLFVCELLFRAIVLRWSRFSARVLALAICGFAGLVVAVALPFRLPFSSDVALVAVVFYGAGYLSRERLLGSAPLPLVWLLLVGALSLWLGIANGKATMDARWYTHNHLLFFIDAGLGILFWTEIAKRLGNALPWLSRVGRHTMTLFCLHLFSFSSLNGVLNLIFHVPLDSIKAWPGSAPLYTLWAVCVLLPVSLLITRRWPALVGQRPRRASHS